jgi:MerR family transcriptional regulator, light-induced transcriptional regulator
MIAQPKGSLLASLQTTLSIAAMERETGLSKDTLRVWERRYGFPMPERDPYGERVYSSEQLTKLRVICRLIDSGYRPGKIVRMSLGHLESLGAEIASTSAPKEGGLEGNHDIALLLDLCKTHQVDELRSMLNQASLKKGLEHFVVKTVAPLTAAVGEAWAKGDLSIFEEHLYTESMQVVMRNAIGNIPATHHGPRALLTTFPIEPHGLGLLMAEAILSLHGAKCFSLGTQTPVRDIVLASQAQSIDIVALSFSGHLNSNHVLDGLNELRQQLPSKIEIWAGGQAAILHRKPPQGIRVVTSLSNIQSALKSWRSAANSEPHSSMLSA